MIPRKAGQFATGDTLAPTRLNIGFEQMVRDLSASSDKRYCYSSFELDFTGMTAASVAADATVASYLIKAPFAYEIVAIELIGYAPLVVTATSVSLTNTLTGAVALACTLGTGVARGYAVQNMNAKSASLTEQTFTLAVTGALWTLGTTYAIVHIRADRGNAGDTYNSESILNAPRFAAGDSVSATTMNSAFTNYETMTTRNTAANKQLRIQVFSMRPVASTIAASDRDWRIFAGGTRFHSGDVVNHGAAGDDITCTLLDQVPASVFAVTVLGSGAPPTKTQSTSIADTQGSNAPKNSAVDYTMRFSRDTSTPAAIPLAYCVLYSS